MANCIKHRMPNGAIMDGPVHGPNQHCIEWAKSGGVIKKTIKKKQSKQSGGYLIGPSHDQGGIGAIVDGTEPIEVEGGEFIINKQTVDALGEDFLHKLNSTQTEYHTGGFGQGQLPQPSLFEFGGKVHYNKINNKQFEFGGSTTKKRRVSINRKKLLDGDITCPSNMYLQDGACFQRSGNPDKTGHRARGVQSYQRGGPIKKINKRPRAKIRKAEIARHKVGSIKRVTGISIGHSHTMMVDIDGNGKTVGGTHYHIVKGFLTDIYCDDTGKCHSHS